ncbi:MAG TPA: TetR/AcrR family transcriptional regulator [Aeromicrobium sp.]|nr:TetR/AcrR family transcriptional regulator [Aeromicrobium sp.]
MATRRQQIIDTAAELFASRGYHGVSVNDIGAACGISGPALYKHFPSKQALLAASLTEISETLRDEGRQRVAASDSPQSALSALIDWHVDFALTHPSRIVIQDREWSNLDPDAQATVRRIQLAYIDVWVDVLVALRPALDPPTARAAVQAGFGLLNSTPHSARVGVADMRTLLHAMAMSALTHSA